MYKSLLGLHAEMSRQQCAWSDSCKPRAIKNSNCVHCKLIPQILIHEVGRGVKGMTMSPIAHKMCGLYENYQTSYLENLGKYWDHESWLL